MKSSLTSTLLAKKISKTIGGKLVVDHVDLKLQQGEVFGLLGPNGAGKTTCFYLMLGLQRPDVGSIYLDQVDISKLPLDKRAQLGLSYLPQETSVFRKLTVYQNIAAVLEIHQQQRKDPIAPQVKKILGSFRLEECQDRLAGVLSGGEKRRLEIARAMAWRPRFLLLDEPFAGIDPKSVQEIKLFIKKIKLQGVGVMLTDHNVHDTLAICTHAAIMFHGKILIEGEPAELIKNKDAQKLYLGDDFSLNR